MKYAAINAKIKAMRSVRHEAIARQAADICRYIPGKLHRDYVKAMAQAGQTGDIHYYTTQWKRLARLDKPNPAALKSILGAEIDLKNIMWMYRLKRYYRITGDATFGYLIPIRYKLSRDLTRRMADCITPAALLDEVASCVYAQDFEHMTNMPPRVPTPEQMLLAATCRRYQAAARRYPDSLAPALAYLCRAKQLETNPVYLSNYKTAGDIYW